MFLLVELLAQWHKAWQVLIGHLFATNNLDRVPCSVFILPCPPQSNLMVVAGIPYRL